MKKTATLALISTLIVLLIGSQVWGQWGQGSQQGPARRGRHMGGPQGQFRGGPQGRFQGGPQGRMQRGPQRGQRGPGGPGRGPAILRVLHQLELTEEQREEVKTIMTDHKEAAKTTHQALRDAQIVLHEAVVDGAGEEVIRSAAADVGTAMADQAVGQSALVTSIKEVLTEEQLTKLAEMREEMKERMEKGREAREKLENCECQCDCPRCQRPDPDDRGPRGRGGQRGQQFGPQGRRGRRGPGR